MPRGSLACSGVVWGSLVALERNMCRLLPDKSVTLGKRVVCRGHIGGLKGFKLLHPNKEKLLNLIKI